jgi:hypothetical protein
MNKLLTIAVPTYARPEKLLLLWRDVLKPLHEVYPDFLDIFIQDNSVSVNSYPATFLSEVFSSAKYVLNEKNIGYHGNILALLRSATSQYIWFWSDDDDYDYAVVSDLIGNLVDGVLAADVILPPFSYSQKKTYLSSNAYPSFDKLSSSARIADGYAVRTDFESLLRAGCYPYVPLTSSLIIKIEPRPSGHILAACQQNAWLHEVVMLSCVNRSTTVDLVYCKPFVYYEETYDSHGQPLKSGMSISYYHDNHIQLCQLRSVVFSDESLFSEVGCWTGTLLWLLQQKDKSINWSNNFLVELRLAFLGLFMGIKLKSKRLFLLSLTYIFLPSSAIRWLRRRRASRMPSR